MTTSGYGRTLASMVRSRDEDMLEPILPKHPPTARDDLGEGGVVDAEATEARAMVGGASRPTWDRLVLVACAVVATLALVVVALRANSIAEDQRVQTCQIRAYAAEEGAFEATGRSAQRRLAQRLAECVGIEPDAADETD